MNTGTRQQPIEPAAVAEAPVYRLRGVTRHYGGGGLAVRALDGIELEIAAGEFVVVAGPSGSGKSTLLQLLGALDRPSSGEVVFEGRDLARVGEGELADLRLKALGFIFQQFNLIPTLTASENVEVALAPTGLASAERRARAAALLDRVGLGARLEHLPSQLSGGEQQRVAIARALVTEPVVLLADEPTGNLDQATGRAVLDLLEEINAERQVALVVVTHDREVAGRARRRIEMRDGVVVSDSGPE